MRGRRDNSGVAPACAAVHFPELDPSGEISIDSYINQKNALEDQGEQPMWKVNSTTPEAWRNRRHRFALALGALLVAGVANAQYGQYPMMDAVADRVVQKYQNASCEQ